MKNIRLVIGFAAIGAVMSAGPAISAESGVAPGKGAYIGGAPAELSADETARQLANPNTPLATLTLKSQWQHWGGDLPGADGADSGLFLFQPSFPFPLSKTDSVFCRPAFPYLVDQPVVDAAGKVGSETGFGDMGMDLAFGRTTPSGHIFAAGMLAGLPTGADRLSGDTWTLGPELLVGKLSKNGILALFPSHQWDVSGPRKTNLTSIQPVAVGLPGGGWAIGTSGSITYNWEAEQWTVPLNLTLSKTVKIGKVPFKLALEVNRYVERPDALGQDWIVGLNIAPVVPNVLAGWLGAK